jgi:hypothetical protein
MLAVLPATSVDCERGFSNLTRIKNNTSNKLGDKHLESLMRTSAVNMDAETFYQYNSLLVARWRRIVERRMSGRADTIT